jgi:hypothetical protein
MRGPSASFGAHGGFRGGSRFGGRGFSGRGFVGHGGFGRRSFFPDRRFHSHRFFNGYPGIYASPYYGYPYYDTLGFGYSSYDSSSDAAAYDSSQYQQQLSQQMYDLSTQVRDLRDQNDQLRYELEHSRYRGEYQSQPSATPQSLPSNPTHETPETILVFQDGHRLETRSYAVVGQTLWILSSKRAQRITLSELNLDETKKLNAERGVEFDLPTNR